MFIDGRRQRSNLLIVGIYCCTYIHTYFPIYRYTERGRIGRINLFAQIKLKLQILILVRSALESEVSRNGV